MKLNSDKKDNDLLDIYYNMYLSRLIDFAEIDLVNSGEANFLASSRGHEGGAILAPLLNKSDWLHCHYRDKALMLARGIKSEDFFYSSLCKSESHSSGRQMVSHMSSREHNVMSLVGPVGNNALQAAGVAHAVKDEKNNPIVLCSIGDGTSQQGEVLEAIAEAKRNNLPVLFFIHNNNLAISTRTEGKTFFSLPDDLKSKNFYGIPINYCNGTNPLNEYNKIQDIIQEMRKSKSPSIIIFEVERLDNHSNADDQKLYRTEAELKEAYKKDPITLSRDYLLLNGFSDSQIKAIESKAKDEITRSLEKARTGTQPETEKDAIKPLPDNLKHGSIENRGKFEDDSGERLTMLETFKEVFRHQLANDSDISLFGEDIEDGKGDVFGITKGLSTLFPNQVKNSPLSESTIIGLSIGMSLAGKKPVAFIQFADFAPPAYNQIFTELATMYWRTNGTWQCPLIVFMPCGGYRPGLGPFHSQTNEATYAHIPGLDVYMPSNAADAAGMLNAAFASGRPSIFLYPKKMLNNAQLKYTTPSDIQNRIIPIGKARIEKVGNDITFVGWGNTLELCIEASESLDKINIDSEIIDLRTIKPIDYETIAKSVEKTKKLVVVHEDNITCGIGAEIIATMTEMLDVKFKAVRVARYDTYTPCNYKNHTEVLPSYERVITAAAKILDLNIEWKKQESKTGVYTVDVIGSSPSDESVLIINMPIEVGQNIKSGDKIVDIEASKSAGEILSPVDGVVSKIYVEINDQATVGEKLIDIELSKNSNAIQQEKRQVILSHKLQETSKTDANKITKSIGKVGISIPSFKMGSRKITNQMLLENFPAASHEGIVERTGIHNRFWLDKNESIIDYASDVSTELFKKLDITLQDIDLVICATCSPEKYTSPSAACMILEKLCLKYGQHNIPAYDISAACSGYLYALQAAKDYLSTRPDQRILLITAENLSNKINIRDFDTAFLFGDAATATLVCGEENINQTIARIDDLLLTSTPDDGSTLNVPASCTINEGITLKGKKLFSFAVKNMSSVMNKCCKDNNIQLTEIDLVIPHQANQRISYAIENRLKLEHGKLFSNIANYGNTSSCTIPIALAETMSGLGENKTIALCAFGAGFTVGAGILTTHNKDTNKG